MALITYSEIKQSSLLIILFFLSFALYFTIFTLIPQLFDIDLSSTYLTFIYAFASPIATIPLILYVNKKTGTPLNWKLSPPKQSSLVLLVFFVLALIIATNPLNNFKSYFNYLFNNKISGLSVAFPDFNVDIIIKLVGIVFFAPIIEEYFIRKQILGILLTKLSPNLAIILSSLYFAIAHLKIDSLLYLFVWGLVLGFLFFKTKSIELCIIIHALWNLAGLFLIEKLMILEAPYFLYHFGLIFISTVIAYFILRKLVGNFKSKEVKSLNQSK